MNEGSFVHSFDSRDERDVFYVVIETGIATRSGPTSRIALPETPERAVYRLDKFLRSADAEVEALVADAKALAPKVTP